MNQLLGLGTIEWTIKTNEKNTHTHTLEFLKLSSQKKKMFTPNDGNIMNFEYILICKLKRIIIF